MSHDDCLVLSVSLIIPQPVRSKQMLADSKMIHIRVFGSEIFTLYNSYCWIGLIKRLSLLGSVAAVTWQSHTLQSDLTANTPTSHHVLVVKVFSAVPDGVFPHKWWSVALWGHDSVSRPYLYVGEESLYRRQAIWEEEWWGEARRQSLSSQWQPLVAVSCCGGAHGVFLCNDNKHQWKWIQGLHNTTCEMSAKHASCKIGEAFLTRIDPCLNWPMAATVFICRSQSQHPPPCRSLVDWLVSYHFVSIASSQGLSVGLNNINQNINPPHPHPPYTHT